MGGRFGEDEGCFVAALFAVERFGGVLEHPAASGAWHAYGLPVPELEGGWSQLDGRPGWACHVEQGHYGHRARKATWLYYVGQAAPPPLVWGPAPQRGVWVASSASMPEGFSACTTEERSATPEPFAELLLQLALGSTSRDASTWRRDTSQAPHDVSHELHDDSEAAGAATFPRGPATLRACAWCDGPIAEGARSHAVTCSKRCRQARQRWAAQGRAVPPGARHIRLARDG